MTRAKLLLLCALACACTGCTSSTKMHGPSTDATVTRTVEAPDGTKTTTTEHVKADGPSGESAGDKAALDLKGAPQNVKTKNISTDGGRLDGDGSASITHSSGARWTVGIVGFVLLCAGGAGLYFRQPLKASTGTAAIGIGLICCGIWIDLALYILLGLALYTAATLWLTGFDAARFREALRAVAEGVDTLAKTNPEAHKAVTAAIAQPATDQDKATIRSIRSKDGLQ